jgi:hypothetical protein
VACHLLDRSFIMTTSTKKPNKQPATANKEAQAKQEASKNPNRDDIHEQREPNQKREATVKKR